MKCAVGVLIKDEHYNSVFNHQSVDSPLVGEALKLSGVDVEQCIPVGDGNISVLNFLHNLQAIHDYNAPSRWYWELEEFADEHNLTFNPPHKVA
jgi:hypothetical protein